MNTIHNLEAKLIPLVKPMSEDEFFNLVGSIEATCVDAWCDFWNDQVNYEEA